MTAPTAQAPAPHAAEPLGAAAPRPLRLLAAAVGCGVLAVLLLALLLAGGRPEPSVPGLPDAGPGTGWGLPVVRLGFDLAAVACVGALLTAVALRRPAAVLPPDVRRIVRAASWSAAAWSVTSLLLLVLSTSESLGVPVGRLTAQDVTAQVGRSAGRALVVVAAATLVVAVACRTVRTSHGARWLLAAAVFGLLPTTLAGHAASAADHQLAVSSLVVHVVSATLWVGGLLGVLLLLRTAADLAPAVRRFSTLALACFVLVALSGLLSAWERLGTSAAAWTSGYGALVLAKAALLLALGAAGQRHRARLVPALAAGRRGAFLSFAAVELAVMGGALALAVALSRTPTPPAAPTTVTVAAHGAGHATLPTEVAPVSAAGLLLEGRLDAIALTVLALAAAAYLTGVWRVHAAGAPWPAARTAAFLAGLAVALLALCGGVATYAAAMISVHLAQFFLLLLVAPALLLQGAPLTLLRRVRVSTDPAGRTDAVWPGLRAPTSRLLLDPLTTMVLVAGLVFSVYRTGLLEVALGSAEVSLLLDVAALVAGVLLLWPTLGPDPLPQPRGRLERTAPLLASACTLAVLAAQLLLSDQVLANRWFTELAWTWVDPAADQRLGGVVVATAVVLLLVLTAATWRPRRTAGPPDLAALEVAPAAHG